MSEPAELLSLFGHRLPTVTEQEICEVLSRKEGFGMGWVILQLIRKAHPPAPFRSLDLTDFSLGGGKLGLLFSSLPPGTLETLKLGPRMRASTRPAIGQFLRGAGGGTADGGGVKTLTAANCDLEFVDEVSDIFRSLPRSLQHLDVSGNKLNRLSIEPLGSVLSEGALSNLLSLNLSNNPLGPPGVRAVARGLSAPLQSLRLACTNAGAEGTQALAEVVKAKKLTSLETLDLSDNSVPDLKPLTVALATEGATPLLQILIQKKNRNAYGRAQGDRLIPLGPVPPASLPAFDLPQLQEIDLSHTVEEHLSNAVIGDPSRFPKLRVVNLEKCCINSDPREPRNIFVFARALAEAGASGTAERPPLEELNLSSLDGQFHAEDQSNGVGKLAEVIGSGHLSRLTRLSLKDGLSRPHQAELTTLCRAFANGQTPNLHTLELHVGFPDEDENGDIQFENFNEGVQHLTSAVREGRLPKMESLDINLWCGNVASGVMSGLGRVLGSRGGSTLKVLKLTWDCQHDTMGAGLGGLAESFSEGELPLLEHLRLKLIDSPAGPGESVALGEALSTGKAPPLRLVELIWPLDENLSSLCDGLSVGTSPPPQMRLDLEIHRESATHAAEGPACARLTQAIRAGTIPFLKKLNMSQTYFFDPDILQAMGEALTHAGASLRHLEEIALQNRPILSVQEDVPVKAFLEGMRRGSGGLPSLHTFRRGPADLESDDYFGLSRTREISADVMRPFFSLVSSGKVVSFRELFVEIGPGGPFTQQNVTQLPDVQAFAAALCSPHVSSLRRLTVSLRNAPMNDPDTPLKMSMFSVGLASEHLSKLEEVRVFAFSQGGMGVSGARALAAGLGSGKLSSLRKLEIVGGGHEAGGGRVLAHVLGESVVREKLPRLRELTLRALGLSDAGLKDLTDAWGLQQPPALVSLDLTTNGLSDAGAETLAAFLQSRRIPSLSRVRLSANRGIQAGRKAMLKRDFPDLVEGV